VNPFFSKILRRFFQFWTFLKMSIFEKSRLLFVEKSKGFKIVKNIVKTGVFEQTT
jgi:hypothetical protein